MSNELATTQNNLPAATQIPHEMGAIAGGTAEDLQFSVYHLFQDVGKERDTYGEHPKGTWVDSINQEAIDKMLILPVTALKEWIVWHSRDSNNRGLVERYANKDEIPDEFSNDSQNYDVQETVSYFVLLEGEVFPGVIRFKSTHLKAAKQLNTLVRRRMALKKPMGIYKIEAIEKSNDKGIWYVPFISPCGDATDAMAASAVAAWNMINGGNFTVVDPDIENNNGDDIPV